MIMPSISTAIQTTVIVSSIPGTMAHICDALKQAQVNIESLCCTEQGDHGALAMITDDPETTKMVFQDFGPVSTNVVLAFSKMNEPGSISDISRQCAGAGININTIYATTHGKKDATVHVVVDDIAKARHVFSM